MRVRLLDGLRDRVTASSFAPRLTRFLAFSAIIAKRIGSKGLSRCASLSRFLALLDQAGNCSAKASEYCPIAKLGLRSTAFCSSRSEASKSPVRMMRAAERVVALRIARIERDRLLRQLPRAPDLAGAIPADLQERALPVHEGEPREAAAASCGRARSSAGNSAPPLRSARGGTCTCASSRGDTPPRRRDSPTASTASARAPETRSATRPRRRWRRRFRFAWRRDRRARGRTAPTRPPRPLVASVSAACTRIWRPIVCTAPCAM